MNWKRTTTTAYGILGGAALSVLPSAGCLTPAAHRRDADRVAYRIVERTQHDALGKSEPFTIETPAETLRRRLMLDQELPYATSASLGTFDVEPIEQWPDNAYLRVSDERAQPDPLTETDAPLVLTLVDALQVGARNSRDYQTQKEQVYQAALQLDLERDAFRSTWTGILDGLFNIDLERPVTINDDGDTDLQRIAGKEEGGTLGVTQRFKNGLSMTALIGLDLATLLTQKRFSSRGVFADASITLPLLRGSGEFVVTEPLTQAERNVVYAIYQFERFKRTFAVRIASDYLSVLQQLDQIKNAEQNYRGLISSTRRAARLAQAGRLPAIQVGQARQDELRSRDRWVSAREQFGRRLDAFKITLGLPTDAELSLDREELTRLAASSERMLGDEAGLTLFEPGETEELPDADAPIELKEPDLQDAGPYELSQAKALRLALDSRLDLRVSIGRVLDAQRTATVAADQLRADLTLLGSGAAGERRTIGSASSPNARLRPDEGSYSALLTLDLALERTFERNVYRGSLIGFEQSVRDVQELEDQIKLAVRTDLSELLESRESFRIQAEAVKLAERRVASTNLFLEAGRAEIRDLLEAQEALVSAQDALTAAFVNYRVGELNLQRDLGVLQVDEQGIWQEYSP